MISVRLSTIRKASDPQTASATLEPDPPDGGELHAEAQPRHRQNGQDAADGADDLRLAARDDSDEPERRQHDEADDEPRDERGPFASPPRQARVAGSRRLKKSTTGPMNSTRTSLTSVATWPESWLTGNEAAITWGTA